LKLAGLEESEALLAMIVFVIIGAAIALFIHLFVPAVPPIIAYRRKLFRGVSKNHQFFEKFKAELAFIICLAR
jgi:hypothetical protein